MHKYKLYFELFGKKLVTEIVANSEIEAKVKLKDKIIFHKIEKVPIMDKDSEDIFDKIMDILNIIK